MFRIGVIFLAFFLSLGGGVASESGRTPLTPIQLHPNYHGEHQGQAVSQPLPDRHVQYLTTPEERLPYLVQIKNGKLFDSTGKLLDTSQGVVKSRGGISQKSSSAIFVFGEDSKIYLSTKSAIGSFHHSTFLAGKPVWFAGELGVENGNLLFVSNHSGHYAPSPRHGLRFLNRMEEVGMDLSKAVVDFYGYGYEEFFLSEPDAKEIKTFTRYALGDFFKKSYGNPNLMPMMKRYENSIREVLLQDPKALTHLLNTMEQSLLPEQEALLLDAIQKYQDQIFDDPVRTRNFKYNFSRPVVLTLSPICQIPGFLKNIFNASKPLAH